MNKNEILEKAKKNSLRTEKVHISDWNADVTIKQLNGKEYLSCANEKDNFWNMVIISCIYDDKGERVFTNNDIEVINNLSAGDYTLLISKITKLNGWDSGNSNPKN